MSAVLTNTRKSSCKLRRADDQEASYKNQHSPLYWDPSRKHPKANHGYCQRHQGDGERPVHQRLEPVEGSNDGTRSGWLD